MYVWDMKVEMNQYRGKKGTNGMGTVKGHGRNTVKAWVCYSILMKYIDSHSEFTSIKN